MNKRSVVGFHPLLDMAILGFLRERCGLPSKNWANKGALETLGLRHYA